MKPVIFHRDAESEVRAGIASYDDQREGLGEEFQEELQKATDRIAAMPGANPPYGDEGLRKHVIPRFPYSIFYLELEELIWVAAVAHQKRRPGYWEKRVPE